MQNGTIIVLAWPEGTVKNVIPGMIFFFQKNGMYRVGHSAIILINNELQSMIILILEDTPPNGFGRVRMKLLTQI